MTSLEPFDLEGYLARIGYAGDRRATPATLAALHASHNQSITFENLDPLLRRPVALDLASLQAKLVHGGRGGWCFEQNRLFATALQALGFDVTPLIARVLWNQVPGAITGRTHMLLRVDVGGEPWIADVGFGGQTLTAPVRLVPGVEQATPHEPYRLLEENGRYLLQFRVALDWLSLYAFDLVPAHAIDYEMSNWYLCTQGSSHFLQSLVIARVEPGRRITLRGNELATHSLIEGTQRRALTTASELRSALEGTFRLRLPDDAKLDPMLERIAATGKA